MQIITIERSFYKQSYTGRFDDIQTANFDIASETHYLAAIV